MLKISNDVMLFSKDLYDMIGMLTFLNNDIEGFIIGLKDSIYFVKKELAIKMLNIEKNRLFQITDDIIPLCCHSNEVSIAALRKPEYERMAFIFHIQDNCNYNKLRGDMNCSFFWENLQRDTIVYLDLPIDDKNPFLEEDA